MDASVVIENVRNCAQSPINEAQTRPLTRLEPLNYKEKKGTGQVTNLSRVQEKVEAISNTP